MKLIRWAALLGGLPAIVWAQNAIVVRGAVVHTAVAPPLNNATIVVRDGKIEAIGIGIAVPAGAKIYEAAGRTIFPGMLDEHSHIAGGRGRPVACWL